MQLHGFNNLTKSLSFNIYDICYALHEADRTRYIQYIDEEYNAQRLTQILKNVAEIIGAKVLNIAHQNYEPEGASVVLLIAEGHQPPFDQSADIEAPGPLPETILAHLDKSHITVHTYPENHPDLGVSTFRADIDVSTCGHISPLKTLNYLIHCFDSDIVTIDYRVRGFTRDENGSKHFIDHPMNSIQNFLAQETLDHYQIIDVNVYQENIFHTKMLLKNFNLDNYLFGISEIELSESQRHTIRNRLRHEMLEIFYGRNMSLPNAAPDRTNMHDVSTEALRS